MRVIKLLEKEICRAIQFVGLNNLSEDIKKLIDKELLSPFIDAHLTLREDEEYEFFMPKADIDNKVFLVNPIFFDVLWVFTYTSVYRYELLTANDIFKKSGKSPILVDENLFNDLEDSLRNLSFRESSDIIWPENVPMPNSNDGLTNDELEYCKITKMVFESTLSLIFQHELAHLILHSSLPENNESITNEEVLAMEKEADNWVFDSLMLLYEDDRHYAFFGVVIWASINLFIADKPYLLSQREHLDIDDRLNYFKDLIEPFYESDSELEYFIGFFCFSMRDYLYRTAPTESHLEPRTKLEIEKLYEFYLNEISRLKSTSV